MINMTTVINTINLTKKYHLGDIEVNALHGVSLSVEKGEFVAIMGASGSGKSTFMNVLGCLDQPSTGDYYLDGINMKGLTRNQYADIRNRKIGFVFQGFNLLSRTTAIENVELPLFYNRSNNVKDHHKIASEALERVGLKDRLDHEPNQLSGGQQQRVAIARALVNKPALILADEPTGNLDSATSIEIMSIFQELNNQGITVIIVTHETDISEYTRRVVVMRDGNIIKDAPVIKRRDAKENLNSILLNDNNS